MTRAFLLAALSLVALGAPASAQQAQQQPALTPLPAVARPLEQMSRQELRDAVTQLRGYVNNGAVRPIPSPAACTAAEYRQLDFWLGEWQVTPSGAPEHQVAESTISLHDQGCVIMENWRSHVGPHGISINIYDNVTRSWHQTYAGAGGRRSPYEGHFENGVMALNALNPAPGPQGQAQRQRMSYRAIDANTVRQWGENFDPATNTWTTTFDFTYRRRPGTAAPRAQ